MIKSIASLQEEITPFRGQDCQLVYRVRTNKNLNVDANITGWTLLWVLCEDAGDSAAVLTRTTSSGISLATPYATVTLSAAQTGALVAETIYRMMLWRNDSGNLYPLTGLGYFIPQDSPPLV